MKRLEGLIAAPPTPMREDGSLNLDAVEPLYRLLRANGVCGAFVCGTTGEGVSLTVAERRAVAERWCRTAEDGFSVIVHVGHDCLADACSLAAHAEQCGAHAVGSMGPAFLRPTGIGELAAWCAQIAASAPALPFYYYDFPQLTGLPFTLAEFLAAASGRVPTLAGAKYSGHDLFDFSRALAFEAGRFDLLFGSTEMLLSAVVLGARGSVGTNFNFAAPLYARIFDAFYAGDMETARRLQQQAVQLKVVMGRYGGLAAVKPAMRMIGLDCGPSRLPLRTLDDAACTSLRHELDAIGFADWSCRWRRSI